MAHTSLRPSENANPIAHGVTVPQHPTFEPVCSPCAGGSRQPPRPPLDSVCSSATASGLGSPPHGGPSVLAQAALAVRKNRDAPACGVSVDGPTATSGISGSSTAMMRRLIVLPEPCALPFGRLALLSSPLGGDTQPRETRARGFPEASRTARALSLRGGGGEGGCVGPRCHRPRSRAVTLGSDVVGRSTVAPAACASSCSPKPLP